MEHTESCIKHQRPISTHDNVDEVVTTRKNLQVTTASPTFDEQMLEYKQAQKNRLRALNLSRNTSLYFDVQKREYTQNRIRKESLKKSTKAKRNFHIFGIMVTHNNRSERRIS